MKKKHIYLFVLLSFIALFMTNAQNTLEVYAEPESYTGDQVLLNDDSAHVNISYRIESQIVKWSIAYEKYGNEPQQQLKIAVSPLSGFAALHGLDQLTTEGDWLLLSDYDDALTGKISFETSIAIGEMDGEYGLSVSVQRSLRQETAGESTAEIDVLDGTPQQILVAEDHLGLLLSGQNNDGSTTSSSGTEEGSTTQSTATTESDNETSEDSSSDESLLNNQSIKPRVDTSGGQGSLVVSDKIFNDPEDMYIEVTAKTLPVPQHTITLKDKNTTRKNYDSDSDNLNYVYSNYLDGSGKVNIQFEEIATQSYLSNVTVTVRYPHVGFIIDQSGELIPIGVTLTIDNIQRSPSPTTWTGYPFAKPSIDLSTNLYSGMVLNGISAADFSFVFTESDGTEVDFSQLTNPFMTFSSLNGYGTNESEFVRATDDREGTVTSDTIINKGTVTTPNNQNFSLTFDNVYHGTNIDFDDFLGSSTYNRSSVSFELIGEKNTFQIGTGGGAGHRGWFTFASAAITPIMQEAPAKTVQPLQQYQANDTWNSPSGEASGWAQRFYNDLDRLGADETPHGPWELLSKHRVSGHDADIPDELADGVPQKAERYVERGKEYYYFINQPTINLVSEGLVTPSGYQIVDTLPDSLEFLSAELFDLKGNAMGKINSSTSPPLLTFTLSEDQVSTINAQSKEPDYYGEDFSIRILFRVKDDADSQAIDNKAYSVFSYPDNISFKQQSNTVQIKVKEIGGSIEIKKTDSFGMDTPVAGTAFSLYQLDDEKEDKKGEKFGEEKWTVAGKTLVFEGIPVGRYVLSETGTVGKFVKGTDFYFDITETGETVWLDKSGEALAQQPDGVHVIINTKGYDLSLLKTDDNGNGLPGAVFTLSGEGLAEPIEVTSNESGSISFTDGILQAGGEYTLTETKAPSGYLTSSEGPWKISITTDGLRAIIRAKDGTTTDLTVTTSDIAPDEYYQITGPDGFSIKNYPQVPLPATGGPGVWPYFIVGAFIIGCALIRRTMTAKGGRY